MSTDYVSCALITPMKRVLSLLFAICIIVLVSCQGPENVVSNVPVSSIRLSLTSIELYPGETAQLTATVLPANASDKTVKWTTSESSIATTDDNGLITAIGVGNTVITASAGKKSASCTVSIRPHPDSPKEFAEERAFLERLFSATNGVDWLHKDNWCSSLPIKEWYGISLDDDGHVISINLQNNSLKGVLPEGFDILTKLEYVSFKNNELEDFIPKSLVNADFFPYIWGDILCGNHIRKRTFLAESVPGPDVSATDVLKGGSVSLSKSDYSEYELTYIGQWYHERVDDNDLSFNLVSASIHSFKPEYQEKPDEYVLLVSDGSEAQIKRDISYDPEITDVTYKAISTEVEKPFNGLAFYPISDYNEYAWVTIGQDGIITDTNLLFDDLEEVVHSKEELVYGQNQHSISIPPEITEENLSTSFAPWALFAGKKLTVKYRCPNDWVHFKEGGLATYNSNDFSGVRSTLIYADMYYKGIPVLRLYYIVVQDRVMYRVEVTTNKAEFHYWERFDTKGEKVLFYKPYRDTVSFKIRSNSNCLHYKNFDIVDSNDPQDVKYFATESDCTQDDYPIVIKPLEETDTAGTGYEYNYEVKVAVSANHCFEHEYSMDDDDDDKRGLAKVFRMIILPYIEHISNWDPETRCFVYIRKNVEGDIDHDKLYIIQSPVVVALNKYDWQDACPIARDDAEIPGYCPVFTSSDEGYSIINTIYANVDWNWGDLVTPASTGWGFVISDQHMSGHSDGKKITANSFSIHVPQQSGINGLEYNSTWGTYQIRPTRTISHRSTRLYIAVDLKDNREPEYLPLLHIFQYSIPTISIKSFTWDGNWNNVYNSKYNYKTHAYTMFNLSILGVGGSKFQTNITNALSTENSTQYTWQSWYTYPEYYLDTQINTYRELYSYKQGFTGYLDSRLEYPNGICIYMQDGPRKYSTQNLPVELNPIPFTSPATTNNKSKTIKSLSYPNNSIPLTPINPTSGQLSRFVP